MEKMEKVNLIIGKLLEDGWSINNINMGGRDSVVATKKYAEISITTEECMCHGGRMWIKNNHTNSHYEISHSEYDESKGIIDSSTELKYIIENEMMDYVNRFSTMVYKLVKINEYGKNYDGTQKENIEYFSNMSSVTKRILDNHTSEIEDFNIIEKETTLYPNRNVKKETERIYKKAEYSWEENRIWFKSSRLTRKNEKKEFEVERENEMYVEIFKKR